MQELTVRDRMLRQHDERSNYLGVHLLHSERRAWRFAFEGTQNASESALDSGREIIGMILGEQGHGIWNDKHMAVFFYQLRGRCRPSLNSSHRTGWVSFIENNHDGANMPPAHPLYCNAMLQNAQSLCSGPDFLSHPATGITQPTLDKETITLIQAEDEENPSANMR